MSRLPARSIVAPVLGQIQFAIDEGMAQGRHVGEENAHLAVFHAVGESAILGSDASGVVTAFEEATFVNDEDGEDLRG